MMANTKREGKVKVVGDRLFRDATRDFRASRRVWTLSSSSSP